MRVLLVVHQYLPDNFAGTEQLTRKVARALRQRGDEVAIVTADPASARDGTAGLSEDEVDGIRVFRLRGVRGRRDWFASDTDSREIEALFSQILDRFRADIVHVHHFGLLGMGFCDEVKNAGIPLLYTATDFWLICPLSQLEWPHGNVCPGPTPHAGNCLQHVGTRSLAAKSSAAGRLLQVLPQGLFEILSGLSRMVPAGPLRSIASLSGRRDAVRRRCDRIDIAFAATEPVARQLSAAGLPDSRIVDLPFGIEAPRRDQARLAHRSGGPLVIGFIGSLSPHKGAHLLLEALSTLEADRPVEAAIYGDEAANPTYASKLRTLAKAVPHPVSFRGTFPEDEFGVILSDIDVLVLPSTWRENRPLTLLSALLANVPVVVSDMPGMTCEVTHGDNGLIFPPGDVAALAGQLQRFVREPELRYKLAASERRPARLDGYVDVLQEHYRRLLAARRMRDEPNSQ